MTLTGALFTVFASVVAASALGVALSRNVVRAAVFLLFTLSGLAGLYFLLGAEFLGAAQLMVYVGGTLVLVVFGVMLTAQSATLQLRTRPAEWALAALVSAGLFALLLRAALDGPAGLPGSAADEGKPLPGVGEFGKALVGVPALPGEPARPSYLLLFEIASVHLLVVLVGAAHLARARRLPPAEVPSP